MISVYLNKNFNDNCLSDPKHRADDLATTQKTGSLAKKILGVVGLVLGTGLLIGSAITGVGLLFAPPIALAVYALSTICFLSGQKEKKTSLLQEIHSDELDKIMEKIDYSTNEKQIQTYNSNDKPQVNRTNSIIQILATKNQFDLKEGSNACPIMSLLFIENALKEENSIDTDGLDKLLEKGNQLNNQNNPKNSLKNIEDFKYLTKILVDYNCDFGNSWQQSLEKAMTKPGSYGISISHNGYTYAIVKKEDSEGNSTLTFFDSHGYQGSPAFTIRSHENAQAFLNRIQPYMHLHETNRDFEVYTWRL